MTRYVPVFIKAYKKEFVIFFLGSISILFACSLYFYSPADPSLFFYTTAVMPVQNVCGIFGSYSASLLLYFFGIGAWAFLSFLLFINCMLFFSISWRSEWDRVASFALLIVSSSALSHIYAVGYYHGGILGIVMCHITLLFFDQLAAQILFWVCSVIASIVIARDFLFTLCRFSMPIIKFLMSKHFWLPVYRVSSVIAYVISRPIVYLFNRFKAMANGSAVHNEKESIISFERTLMQANYEDKTTWYEEQLWKEYRDEGVIPTDLSPQNNEHIQKSDVFENIKHAIKNESETKDQHNFYTLPSLDIFIGVEDESHDQQLMLELEQRAKILEEKLERFGVSGKVISIKRGPVVTLFEYKPHIDSKISKIIALEDDLALALQALSIRIIAPIPGRSVVGFEVANKHRKGVFLASVVQSPVFAQYEGALPLALGQDTIGNIMIVDLVRMPHLLIAGSTGSGKSVALNGMLVSLLCKLTPDQLRLILIDPKRLEFASYADIAHLLFPIVTNPKDAAPVLRWVVHTMEERYEEMAAFGVRSIDDYNRTVNDEAQKMPYIVVIIDELSDLMMTAGKEIEDLIARITQMARAAGIHMIVATQRPSVDVITGLIKVNFPSRISFRVTSKIDSRTILDCSGADKLLGRGDMLFLDSCEAVLKRIHGAYVSDKEIEELVTHIRRERPTNYLDITKELPQKDDLLHETDDVLYQDVLLFLDSIEEISISLLQRKFRIGYNRSARIIDKLESEGLIEPSTGSKTRKVIR